MRKIIDLLLWTLSFWLIVEPAQAGPVPGLIAAAAAALKAGGLAAMLIKTGLSIALSMGLSLIQKALRKEPGIKTQMQVGGDNPLAFIVGRYATAGQLDYANEWGKAGKTPNAFLTMVISLSDLPVSGLNARVWINGEACTIEWGAAPADKGYPVTEYRKNGKDHMWVWFHDGADVAADGFLTATFGADPDRPWSADMIGRGVAYVIVTMLLNRDLYSGVPNFRWEVDGAKLYDIRKDATNGGSGAHRWDDQATWEFSANPAVIAYNIARGVSFGGKWFYGGNGKAAGLAKARLPAGSWIAAANACDTAITLAAGGTEPQFRAGLEIPVNREPLAAIEDILNAANARMVEIGGVYKIRAGAPGAAVYAFTDDDVIITDDQSYDPFPGLEGTYNAAHASYPEPEEAWAAKDAPPRYNATWEADDGGRRLVAELSYPAVTSPTQVQRLMTAAVNANRRFRRHLITLPPDAWLLEPGDVVSWTSVRNGYAAKTFEVGAMDGAQTYNQVVALLEIDPADYSWGTVNELPWSTGVLVPIATPAQTMTGWQVEPWTLYDAAGGARRPTIRISYDGDLEDVRAVHVQVRLAASAAMVLDGEAPYGDIAAGSKSTVLNGTFLPSSDYEARGKYVPFSARETGWSAWLPVTTPAVLITDVSVELGNLAASAWDAIAGLSAALAAAQNRLEEIAAEVATGQGWQYAQRRVDMQTDAGLASSMDLLAARVTSTENGLVSEAAQLEEVKAALGGVGEQTGAAATAVSSMQATVTQLGTDITALSTSLTTVQAMTDAGTASGLIGWVAQSAPAGVSARFAIEGKITTGGAWRVGGAYFDLLSAGGSRWSFLADQFVVLSTAAGAPVSPFAISGGQVLINNAMIANLTAANIDVATLEVEFAQIANVVIEDGMIAANAVTSSDDDAATGFPLINNTWQDRVSITIESPSANPVMLYYQIYMQSGGSAGGFSAQILLDDVVIYGPWGLSVANNTQTLTASQVLMIPVSAGTHVFKIQAKASGVLSASVASYSLIGQCNKK